MACLPLLAMDSAWAGFDHSAYTDLLKTYVDSDGNVNYRALKENREGLDGYIQSLEAISESNFNRWEKAERIAFLVNAYNVKTLQVIIDHYPIKKHWKAGLLNHPIGIRHIDRAWDRFPVKVGGKRLSLNQIEHDVLRKEYREPRIHMALVCASVSCPNLRQEAYTGDRLDIQLEEQTREFLSSPAKGFRLDPTSGTVWVSAIFKWFKKDFQPSSGASDGFKNDAGEHQGILDFILPHLPEKVAEILVSQSFKVDYLDYDWGLNEPSPPEPK